MIIADIYSTAHSINKWWKIPQIVIDTALGLLVQYKAHTIKIIYFLCYKQVSSSALDFNQCTSIAVIVFKMPSHVVGVCSSNTSNIKSNIKTISIFFFKSACEVTFVIFDTLIVINIYKYLAD